MTENLGITTDPDRQFGKPVIKGTRVPVATVVGNIAAGMDIEEVMKEYNLDREQVLEALKYAGRIIDDEEVVAIQ